MLERTQIFVDTSYLLASFYNSWETGARAQLEIDLPEVVATLGAMVQNHLGQPVHRQLWYDGIPETGPHRYQRALRTCDGVQLRTGQLIEWGERRTQKAVDTRLVADLVLAGVQGQFSDIVLVSGDADMIPGVHEAVERGVRVHLYGFGWDSMSSALRHACDSTTLLDPREDFQDSMQLQVLEGPLPPVIRQNPDWEDTETNPVPQDFPAERETIEVTPNDDADTDTSKDTQSSNSIAVNNTDNHDSATAAAPDTSAHATTPVATQETSTIIESASNQPQHTVAAPVDPENEADAEVLDNRLRHAADLVRVPKLNNFPSIEPNIPKPSSLRVTTYEESYSVTVSKGDESETATQSSSTTVTEEATHPTPRPNPSMMAPRRKLRSRYVPLPNEVWASAGYQTPFDVGQQYARWWYDNAATVEQRDSAHLLSGGGLPPEIDRPLLQFACETLHEYTLTENQRVNLRDGFHSGIRTVLLNNKSMS
ncbi:NYN domain [Corynebacterium kutscheri]|uniref:NYN domain n=1 Tax=Corynebacterium kutscheri TaxID=35755 RepID=A0AB38VR16_9CORY|nr:NYN domain-containing protein [Corynebacterium kutscheri]VEH05816.1 NYN domain [Corynebacterium kutscheri]VEH81709.1 NYN domain [Corynebacterium kutscheri]